jgi:hypothetical protein
MKYSMAFGALQRMMANSDMTTTNGSVRDGTMESDEAGLLNVRLAFELWSKLMEERGDRCKWKGRNDIASCDEHSTATKKRQAT